MSFPPDAELNKFAVNNSSYPAIPFTVEFKERDPTFSDVNYPVQKIWLNKATNVFWFLRNFYLMPNSYFAANWIKMGGANIVESLRDQTGIDVLPDNTNEINVIGDGVYIKTVGNPGTNTLTIEPAGGLTTLYTENTGTATPMAGNLNVLGSGGITTTGSGNTITITPDGTLATVYNEDTGSATPSGGILNVIGGTGIHTSGAGNTITITGTQAGITSIKNQVITSTGTYTPTANMAFCQITMLGAGGSGGGSPTTGASTISTGGGGGAGEYAVGIFTAAEIGASQTVTIGSGGIGVNGMPGGAGGTTSVGALITAFGGGGGSIDGPSQNTSSSAGSGGTGGSGGDYRSPGFIGIPGFSVFVVAQSVVGGFPPYGANSQLGSGGTVGATGAGYGSGGGGTGNVTNEPAKTGGNGAPGVVIIQEFIIA